jgi:hypothetical protein
MDVELLRSGPFRKASGSGDVGCVEVTFRPDLAAVRDSKDPDASPVLVFNTSEWTGFISRLKTGTYDLG